jgi:starvation-inducible DNA-binding protein
MKTEIGVSQENLTTIAHELSRILADEFILYTKTRDAHWNVEGSDFHSMHLFFEKQYNDLAEIIDEVAERIRMLGHYAPATLSKYLELTHLTEESREKNDSMGFIRLLLQAHETIIMHMRGNVERFADLGDAGTSDFITGLIETHEKMAWMLRAHLK